MRPFQAILSLAVAAAIAGCTHSVPADSLQMQLYPAYAPQTPSYTPLYTPAAEPLVSGAATPALPSLGMPTSTMPLGISEFTTLAPIDPLTDLRTMDLSEAAQDIPATQPDAATAQAVTQPDATATSSRPAAQPQYVPGPAVQSGMPDNSGDVAESYPLTYYPEPVYVPQYIYQPSYVPVYYPVYQPYACAPYYCNPSPFCEPPTFGFFFNFTWCPGVIAVDHNHGHRPIGHPHEWPGDRANQRVLLPVAAFPAPAAEKPHPPMVMPKGGAASGSGPRTIAVEPRLHPKPGITPLARGADRAPDREKASRDLKPGQDVQPIIASPVIKPASPAAKLEVPVVRRDPPRERPSTPAVVKLPPVDVPAAPESPIARPAPRLSNAPAKLPVITRIQPLDSAKSAAKDIAKDAAPAPQAKPIVTANRKPDLPNPKPLARAPEPVISRHETAPLSIPRAPEAVVAHREPVAAPAIRAPEVHSAPEPVRAAPQIHAPAPQQAPIAAPSGRGGGLTAGLSIGRGGR